MLSISRQPNPGRECLAAHTAPDGATYQTTATGDLSFIVDPDSYTTTVTAGTVSYTTAGAPRSGIQFGPDGTAYQTTATDYGTGNCTYYIAATTPAGVTTTTTIVGTPTDVVYLAPDGSVLQTVNVGNNVTQIVVIKRAGV